MPDASSPHKNNALQALGQGARGTGHYENFPVASVLCPPALRPAVRAIYHFARTADDIADEGDAPAQARLDALTRYRLALAEAAAGSPHATLWPGVFAPLSQAIGHHQLPLAPLQDLLSAFEQDVRHTASDHRYHDHAELLAYCALSAQPVGRLLLHLVDVNDALALRQSDAICSALQLINFWQDIRVDLSRGRVYLPEDALWRHGVTVESLRARDPDPRASALVADLCQQARALMTDGAPLATRVPGRMGWELRLVVQGGLRLLDHIAAMNHETWRHRPTLRVSDMPLLLWRAWRMELPRA